MDSWSETSTRERTLSSLDAGLEKLSQWIDCLEWTAFEEKKEFYCMVDEVRELNANCNQQRFLDVGGAFFHVSVQTLQAHHPHLLSVVNSSEFCADEEENGYIFIDRDEQWFSSVLGYLREGNVFIPESPAERNALERELRFYSLPPLPTKLLMAIGWAIPDLDLGVKAFVYDFVAGHYFSIEAFGALGRVTSAATCRVGKHLYVLGNFPPGQLMVKRTSLGFECPEDVLVLPQCLPFRNVYRLEYVEGHLVIIGEPVESAISISRPYVFNLTTKALMSHCLCDIPFGDETKTCVIGNSLYFLDEDVFLATSLGDHSWSELPPMPIMRRYFAMVVWDGKIVVSGGVTVGINVIMHDIVDVYDPVLRSWSSLPKMRSPRCRHCAAVMDNNIYIIGGFTGSVFGSEVMEIFDRQTNSWSATNVGFRGPFAKAFVTIP